MQYHVYILLCADGSYYTGLTTDLEYRLAQHNAGEIPGAYTATRRPVKLVWFDTFPSKHDAFLRERQIKGWSRAKKETLINNDWERLQSVVRLERQNRESMK